MSFFETVVHQTLDNKENADQVEQDGPYPASNIAGSYLGAGYYFWDNHLELAHWWGKAHCKDDYFICEGTLKVERHLFFDLVGSRNDQIHFQNLINELGVNKMPIGKIIELLKEMSQKPGYKDIFPYKVIRAVDVATNSFRQQFRLFSDRKRGITSLNPMLIICMLEKNKVHLQTYKIIHPEQYAQ